MRSRVNFLQSHYWQKQHPNFWFVNQSAGGDFSIGDATVEAAVAIASQASPTQWLRLNAIDAAESLVKPHALTARC